MAQLEFSGNFAHTLDSKGRVIIPVSFREALGPSFTIGLNSNFTAIALYPMEKWTAVNAQLAQIPDSDIDGMEYVRLVSGFSFPGCELDGQGRVILPAPLREMAGMQKEIRFVGMIRHFEVWDEERFMARTLSAQNNIVALSAHVNQQYFRRPN